MEALASLSLKPKSEQTYVTGRVPTLDVEIAVM